jgi:hypothetical protein
VAQEETPAGVVDLADAVVLAAQQGRAVMAVQAELMVAVQEEQTLALDVTLVLEQSA